MGSNPGKMRSFRKTLRRMERNLNKQRPNTENGAVVLCNQALTVPAAMHNVTEHGLLLSHAEHAQAWSSLEDRRPKESLACVFDFLESKQVSHDSLTVPPAYRQMARLMAREEQFMEGMILRNIDQKPLFPYVAFGVFDEEDKSGRRFPPSWFNPSPVSPVAKERHHQGVFKERVFLLKKGLDIWCQTSSSPHTGYIISTFKAEGNLEKLDKTWDTWSGANFIQINSSPDLGLLRITFYKQCVAQGYFMYILVCEFTEMLNHLPRAMYLLARLRERMVGYSAIYAVHHRFYGNAHHD